MEIVVTKLEIVLSQRSPGMCPLNLATNIAVTSQNL